ncbi:hypothetical protein BJV77DRAFT_998442 [Russula vinacea]|nr:hypothetical protein BJV77DRAFT_998442 [Russula vinacea]
MPMLAPRIMLALAPGLMRVLHASSVYRGIGSFVKAKLSSPRSVANSIYYLPQHHAALDL